MQEVFTKKYLQLHGNQDEYSEGSVMDNIKNIQL